MVTLIPKQVLQLVTLFVCLLFVFSVKASPSFSDIFIFGDSMSDTGNLASVIGDYPPAYYNNRFSNGPVAVEILGEELDLPTNASLYLVSQNAGTNYAVASAKAGGSASLDLNSQINAFLAARKFSIPKDALYVVFIGGNDVRSARDVPDGQSVETVLQNAVDSIEQNIDRLISSGAKNILVINSIDMGNLPEMFLMDLQISHKPVPGNQTTQNTRRFNDLLGKSVDDIENDRDIKIAEFDSFEFLNRVISRAKLFGFRYVREPCFFFSTLDFHPDCNFGQNADAFLFFDEKHPGSIGQALIGNALFKLVEDFDWEENKDDDDDDDGDYDDNFYILPR